MSIVKPNRLLSALYARNPVGIFIQNYLDSVHKARKVGKKFHFITKKLDGTALVQLKRRSIIKNNKKNGCPTAWAKPISYHHLLLGVDLS